MSIAQALITYAQSSGRNASPLLAAISETRRRRDAAAREPTESPISQPPTTHRPMAGLGGGGAAPATPGAAFAQPGVVRAAASQLGKPYVFGSGPDTSSFDCSDLIQWAYKQVGVDIPRDTYGQMRVLPPKSWDDLKPGDPIYRKNGGHVVLYAGNGKVLAAPHTGTVVQYQPLSNFTGGDYQPYQVAMPRRGR